MTDNEELLVQKEEEASQIDPLKKEIEEKNKIIDEQKSQLLRALADMENLKKRVASEKESFHQFANERLISDLLPVLDGFDRALESSDRSKTEDIIKGVALIKRQMFDILQKMGVLEVEAVDKMFDPNFHEAIMKKESDKPENTVIEEMQKGYTLNGRLIRPSMVIVSGK